jgi:ribosomal protein L11 methyltransferase
MAWVSLSVEVEGTRAEDLADALLEHGALSVEVTDADAGTAHETPLIGEPGEAAEAAWPRSLLSALLDAHLDPVQTLGAACNAIGMPAVAHWHTESVSPRDWVRATQQQFGPIEISSRLWIVPSWCQPPGPEVLMLKLDPGLAFGTGAHPTTWQCLRWLDEHLRFGQSVLDYGCGSGILAIAAKKLGAGRVVAIDIDPDALEVSSRNARENGVMVDVLLPDELPSEGFDVVVANILAGPLKLLAPVLAAHTSLGGQIVLAGILDAQDRAVRAAYAEWFDAVQYCRQAGWTCLVGQRRAAGSCYAGVR